MHTETMSNREQEKEKRRKMRIRNNAAKELRQNRNFRLRRVEDSTKLYERKSMKEILRESREEHD